MLDHFTSVDLKREGLIKGLQREELARRVSKVLGLGFED